MTIPKNLLKQDASGMFADWGVSCKVKRFSGAVDGAGKMSGSFVTVATETYWIQPFDSRRRGGLPRTAEGTDDENLFELYGRFSGYALQVEDKISGPTTVYAYDVIAADQPENFRHAWLKLNRRT